MFQNPTTFGLGQTSAEVVPVASSVRGRPGAIDGTDQRDEGK